MDGETEVENGDANATPINLFGSDLEHSVVETVIAAYHAGLGDVIVPSSQPQRELAQLGRPPFEQV